MNARIVGRAPLAAWLAALLGCGTLLDAAAALLNKGVRFITWNRVEGDQVHAYDWDPSFAENYSM